MSNYGKLVAERTDQYFAALDAAQQNFLKSFATFSASLPASPLSPPPAIPGLPTAQEVIEASFTFAQKLLNQQQSFLQKLVTTTTPSEAPTASAVAFGKAVSPKGKSAN
jgi:hypothetical protein